MYLLTNKHLEDKDAHRPPVTLSPIKAISALRLQHLRRDVVRGPNSSVTVHHASLQRKSRNQYPTKPQHGGLGTVFGRNSVPGVSLMHVTTGASLHKRSCNTSQISRAC